MASAIAIRVVTMKNGSTNFGTMSELAPFIAANGGNSNILSNETVDVDFLEMFDSAYAA